MSSSRLRICACTDTSSAETGSSQMISFGSSTSDAGDRDALALPAGELVRPALGGTRRGRCRPPRARSSTFVALLGVGAALPDPQRLGDDVARPCGAGSATRSGPGRSSACAVRDLAQRPRPSSVVSSLPSKMHRARRSGGGSCMIARPVVDLPQPDSPTRPSVSPAQHVEADARHRVDLAARCGRPGTRRRGPRRAAATSSGSRRWAVPVPAIRPPPRRVPTARARRRVDRCRGRGRRRRPGCARARRCRLGCRPGTSSVRVARGRRPRCSGGSSVAALVLRVRAARREPAARRRVDEVGRAAADDRRAGCGSGRRASGSTCSSASVYGIRMLANSARGRRLLDDLAGVHHGDLVGAAGDDAEVVGDEDHRHVALALLLAASRSRIWACTVTSSAVVGSSANRSFGPQASAIAIMTRWRMPPDSWCGYSLSRRSGSGMPTDCSSASGGLVGVVLRSCRGGSAATR